MPQTNEVSLSVTPVVAKTADRFGKMAVVLPGAVLCPPEGVISRWAWGLRMAGYLLYGIYKEEI